jgi:hypothetical protein
MILSPTGSLERLSADYPPLAQYGFGNILTSVSSVGASLTICTL